MSLNDEIARIQREYADKPALRDAILAGLTPALTGSPAPTSAQPRPETPQSGTGDLSDRQREWRDLRYQAIVAGKDPAEADRLASNELAARHGEPVNPENQSAAELTSQLAATAKAQHAAEDAEMDAKRAAAYAQVAADAEAWATANPGGVDASRGMAKAAANRREAARLADISIGVRDMRQRNPGMAEEQMLGIVSTAVNAEYAARATAPSGVQTASDAVSSAWDAAHKGGE